MKKIEEKILTLFCKHNFDIFPKGYPYKPHVKICKKCGKRITLNSNI
jgi:hypothetical protein